VAEERLPSIVLAKTGFVEDVVTPYLPRTAEDAWLNGPVATPNSGDRCDGSSTDGCSSGADGSSRRSIVSHSGARSKSEQRTLFSSSSSAKSFSKRRVSFSDEPLGGGGLLDEGVVVVGSLSRPPLVTVFLLEGIDDDELRRSSSVSIGGDFASSTSAADAAAAAVADVAAEEAAEAAAEAAVAVTEAAAACAEGELKEGGGACENHAESKAPGLKGTEPKHRADYLPQEASCAP
jgi:hypothetical protein